MYVFQYFWKYMLEIVNYGSRDLSISGYQFKWNEHEVERGNGIPHSGNSIMQDNNQFKPFVIGRNSPNNTQVFKDKLYTIQYNIYIYIYIHVVCIGMQQWDFFNFFIF